MDWTVANLNSLNYGDISDCNYLRECDLEQVIDIVKKENWKTDNFGVETLIRRIFQGIIIGFEDVRDEEGNYEGERAIIRLEGILEN